jgi:AcrR family transcriptional regulator
MSVQSVYFAFHSKANLLHAALERAMPPAARPAPVEQDADAALAQLVEHACLVLAATGGLALAAAAAGPGDEGAREVLDRHEARRARAAAELVHQVRSRRPLATGMTARRAADVVFGLLSPQLWTLMVRDRGWTPKRYAAWSADAIGHALWG